MLPKEVTDHIIPVNEAATLTAAFRNAYPNQPRAAAFTKEAILEVLNQPSCVKLRIYYGLDLTGKITPVLCGVDQNGNDLIVQDKIMDHGVNCPDECDPVSPLNT